MTVGHDAQSFYLIQERRLRVRAMVMVILNMTRLILWRYTHILRVLYRTWGLLMPALGHLTDCPTPLLALPL